MKIRISKVLGVALSLMLVVGFMPAIIVAGQQTANAGTVSNGWNVNITVNNEFNVGDTPFIPQASIAFDTVTQASTVPENDWYNNGTTLSYSTFITKLDNDDVMPADEQFTYGNYYINAFWIYCDSTGQTTAPDNFIINGTKATCIDGYSLENLETGYYFADDSTWGSDCAILVISVFDKKEIPTPAEEAAQATSPKTADSALPFALACGTLAISALGVVALRRKMD